MLQTIMAEDCWISHHWMHLFLHHIMIMAQLVQMITIADGQMIMTQLVQMRTIADHQGDVIEIKATGIILRIQCIMNYILNTFTKVKDQTIIPNKSDSHNKLCENIYEILAPIYDFNSRSMYIVMDKITAKKYYMKIQKYASDLDINAHFKIHTELILHPHPNIITVYEIKNINRTCSFVYEKYDSLNLMKYMMKNKLKDDVLHAIVCQTLEGVNFLHSRNIIHCDLKLENILISKTNQIKIIDYDMSKISDDDGYYYSESIFGTMNYIAPESYELGIYSKKSDIWSLGIVFYTLIVNKLPYGNKITAINSNSNMYRRNEFKHIDMNDVKACIDLNGFNEIYYGLIDSMLKFNEAERMSASDLLMKFLGTEKN